jgi:hypothetical protein
MQRMLARLSNKAVCLYDLYIYALMYADMYKSFFLLSRASGACL